jgi:putative Mg2+ transporter-C (MgtC) family protein
MTLPAWSELVVLLRLDLLGYLLMAVLLGGAVGIERELGGKPAGLRTNILICVGAALFTQLSISLPGRVDAGRIAAQIVSGVGFLGAGTILHTKGNISGLTSAATIWMVAAIGVAVGAGKVYEAGGATLLVVLVLAVLGRVETPLKKRMAISRLVVDVPSDPGRIEDVERVLRETGLELIDMKTDQTGDRTAVEVVLRGPQHLHDKAKLALLRSTGAYKLSVEE